MLRPFRALRPAPDRAAAVAAPPYDVVDVAEARALAAGNPDSFLHVSRPEIDLPDDVDPHADAVHAAGRATLESFETRGVLTRDPAPTFSVYRQRRGGAEQTGVVGLASVADYRAGRVAVHEHTRPDKEDDRTAHLAALGAHDEPVLLMYPAVDAVDAVVATVTARPPTVDLTDHDGVRHTLWVVDDAAELAALEAAFEGVPRLYVADGHHRSAAAARLHERAAATGGTDGPVGDTDGFPVVAFPAEQLTVLAYQRVVAGPLDLDALLGALEARFTVEPVPHAPEPPPRHSFGLYARPRTGDGDGESGGRGAVRGGWHLLTARAGTVDEADPIARLDVAVLQDAVLAPLLGVADPRTDARIAFVGGSRGTTELERLVDEGRYAVAFALHPTSPGEVMAVADAGLVMPPKSTWFDPKLASGLFVHPLR